MRTPEEEIATLIKQMVEHYVDVTTDGEWFEELVDKKIKERFSKIMEKKNDK
tara:strand:+ start:121 stop:276 length:156 start_codon:yes stop_codon:yes gene_type:complete